MLKSWQLPLVKSLEERLRKLERFSANAEPENLMKVSIGDVDIYLSQEADREARNAIIAAVSDKHRKVVGHLEKLGVIVEDLPDRVPDDIKQVSLSLREPA